MRAGRQQRRQRAAAPRSQAGGLPAACVQAMYRGWQILIGPIQPAWHWGKAAKRLQQAPPARHLQLGQCLPPTDPLRPLRRRQAPRGPPAARRQLRQPQLRVSSHPGATASADGDLIDAHKAYRLPISVRRGRGAHHKRSGVEGSRAWAAGGRSMPRQAEKKIIGALGLMQHWLVRKGWAPHQRLMPAQLPVCRRQTDSCLGGRFCVMSGAPARAVSTAAAGRRTVLGWQPLATRGAGMGGAAATGGCRRSPAASRPRPSGQPAGTCPSCGLHTTIYRGLGTTE